MNETPDKLTDDSDTALNHLLGRLPPPQMPGDLAARIVHDVTRLPQLAAEDVDAVRPAVDPIPAAPLIPISSARSHRRWVAWTGGVGATAMAAGLATLMLLPGTVTKQATSPATVAESAPETNKAEATPTSPAQTQPRLAETAPMSATPTAQKPQTEPATAAPSKVEVAESSSGSSSTEATEIRDQTTPTDSIDADDNAELVDGANLAIPDVTGQAPPAPGWGYAPGSATPTVRRSEDDQGEPDTGMQVSRHRGPPSPRRGF